MIFGIGTDICDVRRIEAVLQRQGERFVRKVLTEAEVGVWQQRTARSPERGVRYLATRFSAKEAFSKAVGLGMRLPMTWRRCEIANQPSGQPVLVLHGDLKTWFEGQGLIAHVSVTDESDYAASFVVVERAGPASAVAWVPEAAVPSAVATPAPPPQAPAMPAPLAPPPSPVPAGVSVPQPLSGPATGGDRSILGRFGSPL